MNKYFCRIFQKIMYTGCFLMPWREPKILKNNDELILLLHNRGIDKILVVTDKTISSIGLVNGLVKRLNDERIKYTVYDKTIPNPTIENVEQALELYNKNSCSAIIGFGGGSSIDCAKCVAARVARPRKPVSKMKGLFKILKKTPITIAIPTTSGTGSEATVASVITDPLTHHKYAINDLSLVPHYALLDEKLTTGLPKQITATTGMDALTHAVEAYIGHSNTKKTRTAAEQAVKLIFESLEKAYNDGNDIEARKAMQQASYLAGIAFTRAYVGNVHAISHAISGLYGTAHGLANAVTLPVVLDYYGEKDYKALEKLAPFAGFKDAPEFIQEIKNMNKRMEIPETLEGLDEKDFYFLSENAVREANPLYPVPVIFKKHDFIDILYKLRGNANDNSGISEPAESIF